MSISNAAAMIGLVVFPAAVLFAGLMDLVTLKIRNTLVMGIAVAWIVLAPLAGFSWSEMGASAGVAALVFVITFTMFAAGWIGGGDAKLAAVTALWFSPDQALLYFMYASVLGGFLTLGILHLRSAVLPMALFRMPWVAQLQDKKAGVPYGAAMAPAALIVFAETAWVAHAAL